MEMSFYPSCRHYVVPFTKSCGMSMLVDSSTAQLNPLLALHSWQLLLRWHMLHKDSMCGTYNLKVLGQL